VSVLVAGTILALGILLVLFLLAVNHIPERFNWHVYFVLKSLVGAAVGLFVGFVQKKNAGIIAMVCLLPGIFLQVASRSYPLRTGLAFVVFFLSESLGLLIAFAIAKRLSNARRSVSGAGVSSY
jgi:hypothetical protein